MNADSTYQQGSLDTVGATAPRVNVSTVRNYVLAHPPLHEQREIASFIERETCRIDSRVAEVRRAIHLLKERRSALISAAVTGKIDVRNLVDAEAVAA